MVDDTDSQKDVFIMQLTETSRLHRADLNSAKYVASKTKWQFKYVLSRLQFTRIFVHTDILICSSSLCQM